MIYDFEMNFRFRFLKLLVQVILGRFFNIRSIGIVSIFDVLENIIFIL